MRSHKKFRAKKMIFRGAFGGGLSERKKIQSGVWCVGLKTQNKPALMLIATCRFVKLNWLQHLVSVSLYGGVNKNDSVFALSMGCYEYNSHRSITLDETKGQS